jgi:hypothetical protein
LKGYAFRYSTHHHLRDVYVHLEFGVYGNTKDLNTLLGVDPPPLEAEGNFLCRIPPCFSRRGEVDEPCLFCLKDSTALLCPRLDPGENLLLDGLGVIFSTWPSDLGIEVIHKANRATLPVYIHVHQVRIIKDIED